MHTSVFKWQMKVCVKLKMDLKLRHQMCLSNIVDFNNFSDELTVVFEQFLNQLEAHALYDLFPAK